MNKVEKENVLKLAKIAVIFRNHDTAEFGPNTFWDYALVEILKLVGVEVGVSDDQEEMKINE